MQGLRGPRRLRPGLAGMPIGAGASQKGERTGPATGPAGSLPAPGPILGFLAFDAPTGRDGNHPEIPEKTSPSFGLYWPVATGPGGGYKPQSILSGWGRARPATGEVLAVPHREIPHLPPVGGVPVGAPLQ